MWLFVKNVLFTVIVPGTVAGYVPYYYTRDIAAASGGIDIVAPALFALGGIVYGWCVWDFAVFGRGTPAPIDAPKRLVIRGLYRYTRNPMYVSVVTVILGWCVLYQTRAVLSYALIVATFFHIFVLVYEEPHLRRVFGDEYIAYCSRVGRWLPKLRFR